MCGVVWLVASSLMTAPIAAAAQGNTAGQELTLEELLDVEVTTATLTSEKARDVPARIEVITSADILRRGYRSLIEVLKDLPGFKVELGTDQDLPVDVVVQGIRGTNRVIVLLDGIRISSPTGEPLPILANYPVHMARQVEVMYGPGSALYGADAFSAVVNIITKSASEIAGISASVSRGQSGLSNTSASYGLNLGRNATLVIGGQYLSDRQPNLSDSYPEDYGGFAAQREGTFNTVFGPIVPSDRSPAPYGNRLAAHSVNAMFRAGPLQVMFFQNESRLPTSPAYTPDNAVYSNEAFSLNKLNVGAATLTKTIGAVASTTMIVLSRHELDPQSGYRNVYSGMDRSYKYAYGASAKVEQQVSWKPIPAVKATAGGAFERVRSIPQGADLNAPVRSRNEPGTILGTDIVDTFYDVRYSNFAGYLQTQYTATPALVLTVGGRADHNTRYGNTFNPRVGLVWQASTDTSIKVLYGSAFLAPTPFQAFSHYGGFYSTDGGETYASNFWHLPNPELKPQKKTTAEVTARRSVGSTVDVWGAVFHSRLTDLIRESSDRADRYAGSYKGWPVDLIEVSANQGRERTYGGSVGLNFLRSIASDSHVTSRIALSLANGRVSGDDGGEAIESGGMAPVQLHAGSDFDWKQWSASPRLLIVGRQRLMATVPIDGVTRRHSLAGYAAVDLNVRRQDVFKGVSAFVTVENAFNSRYRNINLRAVNNPEELVGAPQNPRRVTVGLDVRVP